MSITTTKLASSQLASKTAVYLFDDWFDPQTVGRTLAMPVLGELHHQYFRV